MSGPALWRAREPLLLASASPIRRMLLENAGLPVESDAAGVDERAVEADIGSKDPAGLARHLAIAKAGVVSRRHRGRVVIGADQTLALGDAVLHRPVDVPAANAQLAQLAGKTHRLHSGVAIVRDGETLAAFVETAALTMRPLSAHAIDVYAAVAGPERLTASVGAYQIEGLGVHLFDRIEGDHTTILGLPMLAVLRSLRDLDLLAL
jgi:septum formation protein